MIIFMGNFSTQQLSMAENVSILSRGFDTLASIIHIRPVYWNYDYTLAVYPLPHAVSFIDYLLFILPGYSGR